MAKVVFFNLPGASGHVNPAIGIVEALIENGEEVIFYAGEEFRERFTEMGAEFRSYRKWTEHEITDEITHDLLPIVLAQFHMMIDIINPLLELTKEDAPDYIMYDSVCIWGKFISQSLGVPSISCITMIVSHPLILITDWRISLKVMKAVITGMPHTPWARRVLKETVESLGLEFPGAFYYMFDFFASIGDLNIIYNAREFQPYANSLVGEFKYIGTSFRENRDTSDFDLSTYKRSKLVYISMGTINFGTESFYRLCFEAFGNLDLDVILSVGTTTDIASLGAIPNNFTVRNSVPQLEILKQADLFISHGGMNSINESLYYGVPMVIVPQQFEQNYNARRMAKLGVATMLNTKKLSLKKLRHAADLVIENPEYKQKALTAGNILKESGGIPAALGAILDLLKKKNIQSQWSSRKPNKNLSSSSSSL